MFVSGSSARGAIGFACPSDCMFFLAPGLDIEVLVSGHEA
jgi:hypothetical protein